jgi:hypothetical protein
MSTTVSPPSARPAPPSPARVAPPRLRDLLAAEVHRCLHRRLVHVLVGLALVATAIAGVLTFVNVDRDDPVDLVDLWPRGGQDAVLTIPLLLLVFGALLGGASMTGGEWRAGTLAASLTWEGRRTRLALAKVGVPAAVAIAIATALLVVFVLALLPMILTKGSTDGADAAWLASLLAGTVRGLVLVGAAAALGAGIALAARNTVATLAAAFVYLQIVERAVAEWRPGLQPWLIAENAGAFLTGHPPFGVEHGHGAVVGGLVVAGYLAAFLGFTVARFRRIDVVGAA